MCWDLPAKCLHVSVYLLNPKKLYSVFMLPSVRWIHGCRLKPGRRKTHLHAFHLSSHSSFKPERYPVRYKTPRPLADKPRDKSSCHPKTNIQPDTQHKTQDNARSTTYTAYVNLSTWQMQKNAVIPMQGTEMQTKSSFKLLGTTVVLLIALQCYGPMKR